MTNLSNEECTQQSATLQDRGFLLRKLFDLLIKLSASLQLSTKEKVYKILKLCLLILS